MVSPRLGAVPEGRAQAEKEWAEGLPRSPLASLHAVGEGRAGWHPLYFRRRE